MANKSGNRPAPIQDQFLKQGEDKSLTTMVGRVVNISKSPAAKFASGGAGVGAVIGTMVLGPLGAALGGAIGGGLGGYLGAKREARARAAGEV